MITEYNLTTMEYGLQITYDKTKYTVLDGEIIKDYPVGGLIAEFTRLHPAVLKSLILEFEDLNEKFSVDKLIATGLIFHKKLLATYPPAMAIMISVEFQNGFADWTKAVRENRVSELLENYKAEKDDPVFKYIFEDTPYATFGYDTLLQLFLTVYFSFAQTFIAVKHMFNHLIGATKSDSEQEERALDLCVMLFTSHISFQHIDYRIIAINDKLESLYTIKSAMSLLLFELANTQTTNAEYLVCPNCNETFVRDGRSDIIYCNYPSPQNKEKTCREIGAQIARANKEKTDIVTREYRKIYMRLSQQARRNPGDRTKREIFERLTIENIEWRKKLKTGSVSVAAYLTWLKEYK